MALFLLLAVSLCALKTRPILSLRPTTPPLIEGHPFVAIWNSPTTVCRRNDVGLNLQAFQAVSTPAAVPHQFLNIFYEPRLGFYPEIHPDTGEPVRGGIPQNASLAEHLAAAEEDVKRVIAEEHLGLAVIDWEAWRPLWFRNWGSKMVYRASSVAHARKLHPSLPLDEVRRVARVQFERAARSFMEETLQLGLRLRPGHLWGFYLFPDCYNGQWAEPGYTGRCSDKTKVQNQQLMWLWNRSTAHFPSIYLHEGLRDSANARLYVRNRVQESLRLAELSERPLMVPTYVYSRILYRTKNDKFLTQLDLESTIGESAALGAAGVILWGASSDYQTEASCHRLSHFLDHTLSPYVANVTAAALLCSQVLCQGAGRCLRKDYDSASYLHLSAAHFRLRLVGGRYEAVGRPAAADLDAWASVFTCHCYAGSSCSAKLVYPESETRILIRPPC